MARAAPAPPNWGARAALRQRYALIWASTFAVVLSYFGSLVVVRAIDDGGVDCRDTCRDAPDNETGTVLLIGDSILKGYYPIVESILDPGAKCMEDGTVRRGVLAKLVYGRFGSGNGYCGTSYGVNFCLDRYLATTKNNFSVIHFAWGAAAAPPRVVPRGRVPAQASTTSARTSTRPCPSTSTRRTWRPCTASSGARSRPTAR
jgi:hypothetical protein